MAILQQSARRVRQLQRHVEGGSRKMSRQVDARSLDIGSRVQLNNGRSMPWLGLGVYQMGSGEPAVKAIRYALETGYRHIDTARLYGNEAEVGQAVKQCGLPREELFITTKLWNSDMGKGTTTRSIKDSLQRSGLDFFDLILIHAPTAGKEKRIETWLEMEEAQNQGLVKSIGVSNYGVKHLEELKMAGAKTVPSVNQIQLHPFLQQKEIVNYAAQEKIIVQAYCPITRGELLHDPIIVELAKKHGVDGAQICIRWCLQYAVVPLPKSATPARIKSNADVYRFHLDDEDMRKLASLDSGRTVTWNPIDAP